MKRKIFAKVERPQNSIKRLPISFIIGYLKAKQMDESLIGPAEEEFVKEFFVELMEFCEEHQSGESPRPCGSD